MSTADRQAWLETRRSGLGSSDAAPILGLGWKSAADVYRSKVEPAADAEPRGVMARGIALETVVADLYAAAMGMPLLPAVPLCRHPARPWQVASLDRVRADTYGPVELKTTAGFGDGWGEPMTAEVPDRYAVQVQHQLAVTGADFADLAALDVIAWEFRVYRLPADAAFIQWLTDVEDRFWHRHVKPLVPPGPDWERQFDAGIPLPPLPGKTVVMGEDVARLLDRRRLVGEVLREAEAERDRLTAAVTLALGDAERGTCPGWNLKRVSVAEAAVPATTRRAYTRLDVRPAKGGR